MFDCGLETSSHSTSLHGYLERKWFLGIYSKRFCSLEGTTLNIYKEKDCKKLDLRLIISPETKIDIISNDEAKPRFRIIDQQNEEYVFECPNSDSLMRWVLALRGCTFVNPNLSMSMFKVLSVIGRGFYGKVMLCQNIDTQEIVAIKTIHKNRLIMQNKVHTVITERNILTKAQHPFIVSLRFAFQTSSKFYLGLEYAPGGELFYHVQRLGNLPLEDVRLYIAEICLAIQHLHSIGIIYRDLKPENVLLDADGHVKLTDFGLSKDLSLIGETTTTFCGTSEYLAPEVVKRQNYGFAVDWWSVGILTYELLFGIPPFTSPNRIRLFQNICEAEPSFPIGTTPEVIDFIKLLLTKDPKKRPSFENIKTHPFFNGLDFNDVLQKKITPSFKPNIEKLTQPNNFDATFTKETAADSYVMPVIGSQEQYPGFSYVDQEYFDEEENFSDAQAFGPSSFDINQENEHLYNPVFDEIPSSLTDLSLVPVM